MSNLNQSSPKIAVAIRMRYSIISLNPPLITQKRHPKLMTPYKSMSKRGCDRIGPQQCPTHGHSHPLHSVVCYDHDHLFAPFCHDPVSRDARHLEKPSSPHPVLAGVHASPVSRAENLGRTRPLDASPGHGLALSPSAQGELLECPCAGGVVGPGSPQHLATAQGWHPLSRG